MRAVEGVGVDADAVVRDGQSDAVVDGGQTDRQLRGVGVFDRVAEYFLCAVVEQGGGGCRYRYAVVGRLPSDGGSSPAKRRCQPVDAAGLECLVSVKNSDYAQRGCRFAAGIVRHAPTGTSSARRGPASPVIPAS